MCDKRVSCKPEDLCDALFMHLTGNLQSVLPVVKSYRTKCVDENRFQALKIKG